MGCHFFYLFKLISHPQHAFINNEINHGFNILAILKISKYIRFIFMHAFCICVHHFQRRGNDISNVVLAQNATPRRHCTSAICNLPCKVPIFMPIVSCKLIENGTTISILMLRFFMDKSFNRKW